MTRRLTRALALLAWSAALFVAGCGGGGGSSSGGGGSRQTGNPVPEPNALVPNSAPAGGPGITLTVNGGNFVSGSLVLWNGSPRPTTFISASQLRASISSSDISVGGTAGVAVFNPAPGGGLSHGALLFYIVGIPRISSLSPATLAAGSAGFDLLVHGSGFVGSSVVWWHGSPRETFFNASSSLKARIGSSDVATPGVFQVAVVNPQPGGGISAPANFVVLPAPTILQIPTNDLIYDASRDRLYVSVPSRAGADLGNTVAAIDPSTATVVSSVFVGSEPNKLAISDDGTTLYVGLDGDAAVRRVDLATMTAGLQFEVGIHPQYGPMQVEDMEVLPGNPASVAISRIRPGVSPRHGGVAVYDDGVQRPTTTPEHTGSNVIEFSSSAAILYGFNTEGDFAFRRMAVDASGITVTDATFNLLSGWDIEYDGGLVFSNGGNVVNPATLAAVGKYANLLDPRSVRPDGAAARTFFLSSFLAPYDVIIAYERDTFVRAGSLGLGVPKHLTISDLVRWGEDGFAFRSADQVFILRAPELVHPPPLVITTSSLPDTAPGKAYDLTLASEGGTRPITWVLDSGALPGGLSLSAEGRISGVVQPVAADANFSFTVRATDSGGTPQTVTRQLTILVRLGGLVSNNGCPAGATPISNGTLRASISAYGDVDVYSFSGTLGSAVTIEAFAERLELDGNPATLDSYLDTVMELLDSSCARLTYNDDQGGTLDSRIDLALPASGTYFIRLRDWRGDGRPDLIYDLRLEGTN